MCFPPLVYIKNKNLLNIKRLFCLTWNDKLCLEQLLEAEVKKKTTKKQQQKKTPTKKQTKNTKTDCFYQKCSASVTFLWELSNRSTHFGCSFSAT